MRIKMRRVLTLFLMVTPAFSWAGDLSIGEKGEAEYWMNWNNRAAENGGAADEWKKKYTVENLRRKPNGSEVSAIQIEYCLGGRKDGHDLLMKLNDDSLAYEGKRGGIASSIAPQVGAAYENNEKNLHSLNDEIKKRDAAARCR